MEKKSTRVVNWYPHPITGEVRGPFCRWFTCSNVADEYRKNVAPVEDDVEYAAAAMNAIPLLIQIVREQQRALDEIHKRDSWPYYKNMIELGPLATIAKSCRDRVAKLLSDGGVG